jgi:hypothetical protein
MRSKACEGEGFAADKRDLVLGIVLRPDLLHRRSCQRARGSDAMLSVFLIQ